MTWRHLFLASLFIFCMHVAAQAEFRPKLGVDQRHEAIKNQTFTTSSASFQWDMATTWSQIAEYYDLAVHFCDSVRIASGGRLTITPHPAGEMVTSTQVFDAVQNGTVEAGYDWPGYWKDIDQGFMALGSVPFGLDQEGFNLWLYEHNGTQEAQNLYSSYNIQALPCGQGGAELGLFSTAAITRVEDFQGLKVRSPGWFGDILAQLGAEIVSGIPASKIPEAMNNGTLDAAEFSDPVINHTFGFDQAAAHVLQPAVHQPASQFYVLFNAEKWALLPPDLQELVKICAKETQLWSRSWLTRLNIAALETLKANMSFAMINQWLMNSILPQTESYLDGLRTQHPSLDQVLNSQRDCRTSWQFWRLIEHECLCCNALSDCKGDFDRDQDVDGSDLATFASDFGRTDCLKNDP